MEEKTLSQMRAEVIEKLINIEIIINAIISQHYLKKVVKPFLLEVLYDEYFSFALRRRILEKILKKSIPNYDKKQIEDLNRLNTIRNYFAHTGPEIFEGPITPHEGQKGIVPDPRNLDKAIDYTQLYTEFHKLESTVIKYLFNLSKELGVEFGI
jgi:hypothetical protein